MGKTIDKTGERGINNFGSKMIIVEYRKYSDIDVYFPEYDWIAKSTRYDAFKKGEIKCPYEPRVYGVGYVGEGKYKTKENEKHTRVYRTWYDMLRRCYDEKILKEILHMLIVKFLNRFIIFKILLNGIMTIIIK